MATSSGTLATLVFAVAGFALGKSYTPSVMGRALVVAGLILFLGAAGFGLRANALRSYGVAKVKRLLDMTRSHWGDSEELARRETADSNARTVDDLRRGNEQKAFALVLGLLLQVLAVVCLGGAVIWEFFSTTR